jgi:hypothetical protein
MGMPWGGGAIGLWQVAALDRISPDQSHLADACRMRGRIDRKLIASGRPPMAHAMHREEGARTSPPILTF